MFDGGIAECIILVVLPKLTMVRRLSNLIVEYGCTYLFVDADFNYNIVDYLRCFDVAYLLISLVLVVVVSCWLTDLSKTNNCSYIMREAERQGTASSYTPVVAPVRSNNMM